MQEKKIPTDENITGTSDCDSSTHSLESPVLIRQEQFKITRSLREKWYGHKAMTVWFTGLSGSGKSAIAGEVERKLFLEGYHTIVLDGDNLRSGLNKGLGFSPEDRKENIRRAAEVAKLLNDAGVIVLASFISPYKEDRQMAREILGDAFVEVYVNTSLSVCEARDVKGLYARARHGEIKDFTGISSPYEVPSSPDITIDTSSGEIEENAEIVKKEILRYV